MSTEITSDEKVKWSQYELVPVGLYKAEIVKIEKTESPFNKGEFQYQVHFKLDHENSQGEPVIITRMISRKLSPKSKLFELLAAVDNEKPTKERYPEGVKISSLVEKKCRVMIRHQESKETGNTYSKIDVFLPLEKKTSASQESRTKGGETEAKEEGQG